MRHRNISVAHGPWCATEILDFLWRIFCPCATESQIFVAHQARCATEIRHSVAHLARCATESQISVAHMARCATESQRGGAGSNMAKCATDFFFQIPPRRPAWIAFLVLQEENENFKKFQKIKSFDM